MKPKWIVRIVVGVALVIAVALGLLDYQAKSSAQQTAEAWMGLMDQKVAEFALEESVVGSPEVTSAPATKTTEMVTYTWPGILRDYRVEVSCIGKPSKDGKRMVSRIEGPLSD